MPIADRWVPGAESGVSPLLLVGAVVALAIVVTLIAMFVRRRKSGLVLAPELSEPAPVPVRPLGGSSSLAWPIAFVLGCLFIAWGIAARPSAPESGARSSFGARSADLTMRVLALGSPLACLDAVSNTAVEASCEKALYASPETLAAAIAYVDARLSLFVEGSEMARNAGAGDAFERLRRSIEQDRYGLVAHVLTTRGCTADNCPTLKLMRDPALVQANLKDRTFDANVVLHAASWHSEVSTASVAPGAPALASVPGTPMLAGPASTAPSPPTPSSPSKYEFPSAASIPAVSIMNAEPAPPPAAAKPEPPQPAAKPAAPARRQSAREKESHAAPPGPPAQIVPDTPPAPAGTLANPGPAR